MKSLDKGNQDLILNKNKKELIIKRVPRPLGLTYQCIQYNNATNDTIKAKLKYRIYTSIIDTYLRNNLKINNRTLNITKLDILLDTDNRTIIKLITKGYERMANILDDGEGKSIARAVLVLSLEKSLEGLSLATKQASI